jgi:hypothetical protein
MARTATHQLIDRIIRETGEFDDLESLVAARRAVGRSWARIRAEVVEMAGVEVSRHSLYGWFPDYHVKP